MSKLFTLPCGHCHSVWRTKNCHLLSQLLWHPFIYKSKNPSSHPSHHLVQRLLFRENFDLQMEYQMLCPQDFPSGYFPLTHRSYFLLINCNFDVRMIFEFSSCPHGSWSHYNKQTCYSSFHHWPPWGLWCSILWMLRLLHLSLAIAYLPHN